MFGCCILIAPIAIYFKLTEKAVPLDGIFVVLGSIGTVISYIAIIIGILGMIIGVLGFLFCVYEHFYPVCKDDNKNEKKKDININIVNKSNSNGSIHLSDE